MSRSALVVALLIGSCKNCCNQPVPELAVSSLRAQKTGNSELSRLQQHGHENYLGLGKPRRHLLSDCSETPFCEFLPEGWTRHLNTESDCYFYFSLASGVSTWNCPPCPVVEVVKKEVIVAEEGAWTQVYTPAMGDLWLSAIVASLPVVVLLGLIAFSTIKAHIAAFLGLTAALLVAILVYQMPATLACMAAVHGACYGLFPIGWIVLNAIFIYDLTVTSGDFEIVKQSIATLGTI